MIEIKIPAILNIDRIEDVLSLCTTIRNQQNIVLSGEDYLFSSVLGMTLLKAAIHSYHQCRISDVKWMDVNHATYLHRNQFFQDVISPSLEIRPRERLNNEGQLIELNRLLEETEVDACASVIAKSIKDAFVRQDAHLQIPNFDEDALISPIEYIIGELLLNATSHAKLHGNPRSKAWVSARVADGGQNKSPTVEIAIVDDGCGILRTLADQLLDYTNHIEALGLAMTEFKSCNLGVDFTGAQTSNQGVGLWVARDMIVAAGGQLTIITDNCMYDSKKRPRKDRFCMLTGGWQGVAISIKLPIEKVYGLKATQSLDKISKPTQSEVALNFS